MDSEVRRRLNRDETQMEKHEREDGGRRKKTHAKTAQNNLCVEDDSLSSPTVHYLSPTDANIYISIFIFG